MGIRQSSENIYVGVVDWERGTYVTEMKIRQNRDSATCAPSCLWLYASKSLLFVQWDMRSKMGEDSRQLSEFLSCRRICLLIIRTLERFWFRTSKFTVITKIKDLLSIYQSCLPTCLHSSQTSIILKTILETWGHSSSLVFTSAWRQSWGSEEGPVGPAPASYPYHRPAPCQGRGTQIK